MLTPGMYLENCPFCPDFPILMSISYLVGSDDYLDFHSFCCYVSVFVSDCINSGSASETSGWTGYGFVYLVDFLKESAPAFVEFCIVLFLSIWLISALSLIIS